MSCHASHKRAYNRRKNAVRHAAERGARMAVGGPLLSIDDLGRRDGWRCHLCHKTVRASLRTPHPGAPTFDHLIPISAGGDDRPENLRLAHFRCNSSRGNRGTVQLLLIG